MPRQNCENPSKEGCKYAPLCFSDLHHNYWPRAQYEALGALAVRWRNLEQNTEQICRREHDERHATQQPPEMPSRDQMVDDLAATDEFVAKNIRNKVKRSLARRSLEVTIDNAGETA